MDDKIDKFLKYFLIASLSYFSIYLTDSLGNFINVYRNKNLIKNMKIISSEDDINNILKLEKKKLFLEELNLEYKINEEIDTPANIEICNEKYILNIKKDFLSKEILKHEIYHLYRFKNGSRKFYYPILRQYEEYLATSYSLEY